MEEGREGRRAEGVLAVFFYVKGLLPCNDVAETHLKFPLKPLSHLLFFPKEIPEVLLLL